MLKLCGILLTRVFFIMLLPGLQIYYSRCGVFLKQKITIIRDILHHVWFISIMKENRHPKYIIVCVVNGYHFGVKRTQRLTWNYFESFMKKVPIIKKPFHRFAEQNQWTGFFRIEISIMKKMKLPMWYTTRYSLVMQLL